MDKALQKDIIGWDITNWAKALQFWERDGDLSKNPLRCLEIGSNNGGLSLWLAQQGHQVVCSDLSNPKEKAFQVHKKYPNLNISYQSVDALNMSFENEFDIIVFKSILGGVSRGKKQENKILVLQEIHKALKPGGRLLFAENLQATKMHQLMRRLFTNWGSSWNYLSVKEVEPLFHQFAKVEYETVGFLGAFGSTKGIRNILGKVDTIINPYLSNNKKYILIGIATK